MDSNTAKVAGPLLAAGAVSLGLVLIGACGIGPDSTRVAPPPLDSAHQAAAAQTDEGSTPTSTTSVARIVIPPSPSWKVASSTHRAAPTTSPNPSAGPLDEGTTRARATTSDESSETTDQPPG